MSTSRRDILKRGAFPRRAQRGRAWLAGGDSLRPFLCPKPTVWDLRHQGATRPFLHLRRKT